MSVLAQDADRDRCDITFVDRRCDGTRVGPAHDIACTDLWGPPDPGICSERGGPQEGLADVRHLNQALNLGVQRRDRIGRSSNAVARG
jgi:hypothetical protein